MTRTESSDAVRGRRIRVALLVPSSNTVMENDLHAALPRDRFTVHTDRMFLVETTREAETRMIEDHAQSAAKHVGTVNPNLLVFGCTSAGSLFGLEHDAKVCRELGDLAGCPSLGVLSSAAEALELARARKVAVITPYIDDLTKSVAEALANNAREIVAAHGMGITVNVRLADPEPAEIVAFAREKLKGVSFDTLFVSCTNFRSLEAKPAMEKEFPGAQVITSNSSVIDAILRRFPA
jgi:maleate isomerase